MDSKPREPYPQALKYAENNAAWIDKNIPENIKRREKTLLSKISLSKGSPLNKLKKLYEEIDVIFSSFESKTACKKGCSHCCHSEIAISDLEIKFIQKNTNARLLSAPILPKAFQACPFLINDACSIYKFRPYVCRTHVSLTKTTRWCEHDVAFDYHFPILRFSEIDKSFRYINFPGDTTPRMQDIRAIFAPHED